MRDVTDTFNLLVTSSVSLRHSAMAAYIHEYIPRIPNIRSTDNRFSKSAYGDPKTNPISFTRKSHWATLYGSMVSVAVALMTISLSPVYGGHSTTAPS